MSAPELTEPEAASREPEREAGREPKGEPESEPEPLRGHSVVSPTSRAALASTFGRPR